MSFVPRNSLKFPAQMKLQVYRFASLLGLSMENKSKCLDEISVSWKIPLILRNVRGREGAEGRGLVPRLGKWW